MAPPGPPIDYACPLLPFVPTTVPASDRAFSLHHGFRRPARRATQGLHPLRAELTSSWQPARLPSSTHFLYQPMGRHVNRTHDRPPTLLNRTIMRKISTKRKCLFGQCGKIRLISSGCQPGRLPCERGFSPAESRLPPILSPYVKKL